MTNEILIIIEALLSTFKEHDLLCGFRDHPKDLRREVGPRPVLSLMGTSGIFSGETCLFRTLNFELVYPVTAANLKDFLDFGERIDDILNSFLQNNDHLALKYSPKFNVSLDKSLYLCIFTLDLTPKDFLAQKAA